MEEKVLAELVEIKSLLVGLQKSVDDLNSKNYSDSSSNETKDNTKEMEEYIAIIEKSNYR